MLLLLLPGCDQTEHIRAEIVRESAGIATLQGIYLLTYANYKENVIYSDDVYIERFKISRDYGFTIDDNAIKIIKASPKDILQVRLKKAEGLATDRVAIDTPSKSHQDYRPRNDDGTPVDIDGIINKEIETEIPKYEKKNLEFAEDNARNLFKVLAAKYDLELDFKIEG